MTLAQWNHRRYQAHAGVSKFRQDGSYKTKSKNQVNLDWRETKGFTKDQSKHRTWCKCGRNLKQNGNRRNRRWSKRMIHTEQYDQLYFHQDMFVSSWDAC